MIARIVEVVAKRGRSEEVCRIVERRVLTLVRRLHGFLGKWTLVSRDDPRRIAFFSFWTTPAAVAEYEKSVYPQVYDLLKDLIRTAPVAQVFDVRNGTSINCVSAW
jgi:heme-degrading monooxygenase HmoA